MIRHIIPHSDVTAHVKPGLQASGRVDAVSLLTEEAFESVTHTLADDLRGDGLQVEIEFIDAEGLSEVLNTIAEIAYRNPEDEIHINIAGGANILAAGATAASIYLRARPYFVAGSQNGEDSEDESVKALPTPTQPLSFEIDGVQRDILEAIGGLEEVSRNGVILNEIGDELNEGAQKVSYHCNALEEKGLIESGNGLLVPSADGRTKIVHLTDFGRFFLQSMSCR